MYYASVKKYLNYIFIFVLPFLVYFFTHSTTIGLNDSGLLAAASKSLGIALPTGLPAYTILSHAFIFLPLGSISDRLYFFSYFSSVILLVLIYLIIKRILNNKNSFYVELSALFACISLAFSYQFWSSSINIESTTFTNLTIFTILFLLLKIHNALEIEKGSLSKKTIKLVYLLFIILGIAAGLNPNAVVILPAILIFGLYKRKQIYNNKVIFLTAGLITLFIIIIEYGFLMIRAQSHTFLNFGEPVSIIRVLGLMLGRELFSKTPQVFSNEIITNSYYFHLSVLQQSISNYVRMFFWEFNPLLIPLIVYGLYKAYKNRFIFWIILGTWIFNALLSIIYVGGNQENWYLTSWTALSLFLGMGVYYLLEFLQEKSILNKFFLRRTHILYFIVMATSLLPLFYWYGKLDRSKMSFTTDYIKNLYSNVDPRSIIIGGGNIFETYTAYAKEVLSFRKDVIPVAGNLFYDFNWYRDNISKATGLSVSRKTQNAVLNYPKDNQGNIILSIIRDNPSRQVYISSDYVRTYMSDTRSTCSKGTCKLGNYILIPYGLLFKIVPSKSLEKANPNDFNFTFASGLPTEYYALEQFIKQEQRALVENYMGGYIGIGDYYSEKKNIIQALEYYKKAEYLNRNGNPESLIRLAVAYQNLNNLDLAKMYYEESLKLLPDNQELRGNYETFMKQNEKYFQQSTQYTQQTAVPSNASYKKYVSLSGYSFNYLSDWKIETVKNQTVIKDPVNSFTVQIQLNSLSNQNFDSYLKGRTDTYGTLIQEGKALIPNFDIGFVRIWNEGGIKKDQFFLVKGDRLIEIMAYPSDSQLMKQFDQIVTSLKLGS